MAVTERGFARMTKMLLDMAEAECGGRLLFVLEGGYDIEALTNSVKATLLELRETPLYLSPEKDDDPRVSATQTVSKSNRYLSPTGGSF